MANDAVQQFLYRNLGDRPFSYETHASGLGRRSNRDGIGAEVRLVTGSGGRRHATARTAGSYLSAGDRRVHLGLGEERRFRSIEIR